MPDERIRIVIEAIDKASVELRGLKKELEGIGAAGQEAGKGLKKADKSIVDTGKALMKIVGFAGAAAVALKQVYDAGKQGAAIAQTTESFNRLGVSIEDLRASSLNTIDDMTLMSSTLTLTAGAGEKLQEQLLQATPQLLEIAKAANKLNPALGDTAFMYQSIATGVKRASPLILDNLGIMVKVGDANKVYAQQIGKAVDELTAEEKQIALLNETMRAGTRLIEQVGGSVESASDSYAQLETNIKNITDGMKVQTSQAIGPLIAKYAEFVQETIDSDKSLIGFAATLRMVNKLMGTNENAFYAYQKAAVRVADKVIPSLTGAMYQLAKDALIPAEENTRAFSRTINANDVALRQQQIALGMTVHQMEEYVKAEEAVIETDALVQTRFNKLTAIFNSDLTPSLENARDKLGELRGAASELKDKIGELEGKRYLTSAQQEELAGLRGELGEVQNSIQGVISDTEKMMQGFVMSMVTSMITVDGKITENETAFLASLGIQWGMWDETYAGMLVTAQDTLVDVEEAWFDPIQAARDMIDVTDEVTARFIEIPESAVPALEEVKSATDENVSRMQLLAIEAQTTQNVINSMTGKTIDLYITTHQRTIRHEQSALDFEEQITSGQPGNAAGTDFWRGGLSWVGERGPELVNLPRGSQVYDNSTSNSIANNFNLNMTTQADSGTVEQDFMLMQARAQ